MARRSPARSSRPRSTTAYAWWVNDTYWLLMPYKMRDPGVTLAMAGRETKGGDSWDKVLLTFDDVGLTPKDRYWVFVNAKTGLVDRWEFVLKGEKTPPVPFEWKGWKAVREDPARRRPREPQGRYPHLLPGPRRAGLRAGRGVREALRGGDAPDPMTVEKEYRDESGDADARGGRRRAPASSSSSSGRRGAASAAPSHRGWRSCSTPTREIRHVKVEDGPGRPLGRSFQVKLWPSLVFLRDGKVVRQLARPTHAELDEAFRDLAGGEA